MEVNDPDLVKRRCTEVLDRVKNVTMEKHGQEVTLSIGAAMAGGETDYDVLLPEGGPGAVSD